MARPTKFTKALAQKICDRIAAGESVRSIGRDEKMPVASTIFDWALHNEAFSEQYVQAKQLGAEIEAEEMEEIARDTTIDPQRAKLIVDTRKWNLSKKLPKRFGDRLTAVSEDDKGNTVPISGMVIQSDNGDSV